MRAPDVFQEAVEFLEKLWPGGPWVLTAIIPDGMTKTITAHKVSAVREFIAAHNGKQNIYYSVNPTRTAVTKKTKKTDIAAIEYLLADLDPKKGESSEDAKARYREALKSFQPAPTAVIDSGNGLQVLWRLAEPIILGDLVSGQFSPEDQAKIADAEARSAALMKLLGYDDTSTKNIDRILRVPGTTNLPNQKKKKEGRADCSTRLLRFNDMSFPLDAFPAANHQEKPRDRGARRGAPDDEDPLSYTIREGENGRYGGDRSRAEFFVINEMLRRGHAIEAIVKVLLDRSNHISEKAYEENDPHKYVTRQIVHARKKIKFATDKNGKPYSSQDNIRIALLKVGVSVRHDRFADRTLIEGLEGFGPTLDDAAMTRLRLMLDTRFRLLTGKEMFYEVVVDAARLNSFHPVRDYLEGLKWDGVERIDTWPITYGGAEDSEYTRAVGALMMIAAVRRVRQPGCKFDEMVVLETTEQGTAKSTMLALLAVREEWFSDDLPLNVEGKRIIETLRGKWIVEAAELSGMKRGEIEHVKALLSRQTDHGRLSYDRLVSEIPRQCIFVGTTNSEEYLKDTTGNRRFWPLWVKRFNLAALIRDRDQLWAEAAAREATGVSIRLKEELWPRAAEEQTQRLTYDPYFEELQVHLGDLEGKIQSADVWVILDVKPGHRNQDQNRRMGEAMRKLSWERANKAGTIKVKGKMVTGYVRGPTPRKLVAVFRDEDGLTVRCLDEEKLEAERAKRAAEREERRRKMM